MALSRIKNWIEEELFFDDLNAEFNNILDNPMALISPFTATLDLDGNTLILDAAAVTQLVSSASASFNVTTGAKTGTPSTTGSMANWSAQTYTDNNTAGSGTAAAWVGFAIQRPTLAATNATVTTTDAATLYVPNGPAAGANETITNSWGFWVDDGGVRLDLTKTVASAASAVLRTFYMPAVTETVTGSTNITTATGFNHIEIGQPTISAASALTITNASTLYIANAPTGAGAGPATITNAYALWIDDGASRFDGAVTLSGATTVVDGSFSILGSADATKIAKFEVDGITTATTRTLTVQDEDGTLALTSEFDYANLAGSSGRMPFPAMWIQGLVQSNNVGDATNDIDISAGQCRDATNAHNMILTALTKQSDVAWAVGTNAGGLDTGAVGNSDYFIWAIKRSDTGVCDVLFSLSATAPTMPANYDYKRLIGWFRRSAGAILAFSADELSGGGLGYMWGTPILDVDVTNPGTSAVSRTLSTPVGFKTLAHFQYVSADASNANSIATYFSDLALADVAVSVTASPLASSNSQTNQRVAGFGRIAVRTNTSAQIRSRVNVSGATSEMKIATLGFDWSRR